MDNSKLSVLKTFSSAGEASIDQSLLESSGIPARTAQRRHGHSGRFRADRSRIRLVVNEADAAKAEEILAAGFDQEEFDTESAKRRKKP